MSENNNNSKAITAGLGYIIGNILIKGINFLTLPLFARLLSTEEFGVYNVFVSYETILVVVISLAVYISIRSANIEFKNQIDKYTSSITLIIFANAAILLLITLLFGNVVSDILNLPVRYIYILVIYSLAGAIIALFNVRVALDYSYKKYLVISFANSIGNISLSLLLILTVFNSAKDFGRIVGVTAAAVFVAMAILVIFYRKERPSVNKGYWRFALKYSLPIVPHGVAQVLLLQFDRIMIRNMINSAAAGIYSLAGNIRLILTIIIDSIANTWQTWFYEEIEKKNTSEIQLRAKQMIGVFAVMCIGLMALSPELVLILGGLEYIDARFVTVPMIMDAFIIFIYNIIIPAEYYKKKTNFVMIGTIFATALNIAGNYIFISRYGFIAAAYTTLFSYVCYLIFHLIISHKVVKFDIVEMPYLFVMTTSVSVIAFVNIFYIDSLIIRWIFTLCMIAAFVFVLNRKYRVVNDTLKLLQKKAHKS